MLTKIRHPQDGLGSQRRRGLIGGAAVLAFLLGGVERVVGGGDQPVGIGPISQVYFATPIDTAIGMSAPVQPSASLRPTSSTRREMMRFRARSTPVAAWP